MTTQLIPLGNLGGLMQDHRTLKAGSSSSCSLLVMIDSFIYMQTPPCIPVLLGESIVIINKKNH